MVELYRVNVGEVKKDKIDMAPTDIMFPNEMIKQWLAGHNRVDSDASGSLSSTTPEAVQNPTSKVQRPRPILPTAVQSPTSKVQRPKLNLPTTV